MTREHEYFVGGVMMPRHQCMHVKEGWHDDGEEDGGLAEGGKEQMVKSELSDLGMLLR